MANKLLDLYLAYSFVRRLATPFDQWKAYELGIIDADGKVLRKKSSFTRREEHEAWGYYDIMIANLKRLLGTVPGGKRQLASIAAALLLLREHWEGTGSYTNELELDEGFRTILDELLEDAPTNSAGGGHVAGIRPGEDPPVKHFAGSRVFDVDGKIMHLSRHGKVKPHRYSRYVGADKTGEEIRKYGRSNPKKGIILQDRKTGAMSYLRHPHRGGKR